MAELTMSKVSFWVPGSPAPQGSKRHVGKGILIESSKAVGPWRERVALAAHNAMSGHPPLVGPVEVQLRFCLLRPKSAPKRPTPAVKRPDLDKLVRAVFDALTHVCFADDSQVIELIATKELVPPPGDWSVRDFSPGPGCRITVTELP